MAKRKINGTARASGTFCTGFECRADGWWALGFECGELGPYPTKVDAVNDARGTERFYRENWDECERLLPELSDVRWKAEQRSLFE